MIYTYYKHPQTITEGAANFSDLNIKKWEDYDVVISPSGKQINMTRLVAEQQKAKNALIRLVPFFNDIISRFRFIYTFQVQTQATDGRDIFINPEFTDGLNLQEKVFVLAHEVLHCVFNHLRRGKALGNDMEKLNIAADYECNITIADMTVATNERTHEKIPILDINGIKKLGAYVDEKYRNLGFESIYAQMSAQQRPKQQQNGQQNKSQNGQQNGQQNNQQNKQQKSAAWIKGWNQAIEDYKKGKLKL